MKFTESMLRDFVSTGLSAGEVADLLTMTGFELEELTQVHGETVFDMNIMANRGDAASVFGMAREVIAKDPEAKPTDLFQRAAGRFPLGDEGQREVWGLTTAQVESSQCTRFACRVFEGVENGPSPAWLQDRLSKIGQRPISLLVDLTNYVMFELGQPLHAYDLDKLAGHRIIVRQAVDGEKLTTLDGNEHTLEPHQTMICDGSGPIGVAGVMGGLDTEADDHTTRCLLEAAHFTNTSVRRTRNDLGLATEASYRFERHVDPEGVVGALNRFAELFNQATGRKSVGGVIDICSKAAANPEIHVRMRRANTLLAMDVPIQSAKTYLDRLGFDVNLVGPETLEVTAPSWRIDVLREDDVIEEIGRVHGYEKIPEFAPHGSTGEGGVHGFEEMVDSARDAMLACGYDEIVSHTLRDLHPLDAFGERVKVRTPLSPEMAHLRNSLLPCLADAAQRNGPNGLHIFEVGHVFPGETEHVQLAILSEGDFEGPSWRPRDTSKADFFTLKGAVEELGSVCKLPIQLGPSADPRFHPSRQAAVMLAGVPAGVFGQIHPLVAEASDLSPETVAAEITLSLARDAKPAELNFRQISRNPAVRRDVAILVGKGVPYTEIESAIGKACGDVLERQWLFDVYDGANIPEGHHSLAIALQLRKPGNFTDEEANQVRDAAVAALEGLGARLR